MTANIQTVLVSPEEVSSIRSDVRERVESLAPIERIGPGRVEPERDQIWDKKAQVKK